MEKIKKRAPFYGIAAVLLAIVLAAGCYNFGVYPREFEPAQPPSITPSSLLNTFSFYEELKFPTRKLRNTRILPILRILLGGMLESRSKAMDT